MGHGTATTRTHTYVKGHRRCVVTVETHGTVGHVLAEPFGYDGDVVRWEGTAEGAADFADSLREMLSGTGWEADGR